MSLPAAVGVIVVNWNGATYLKQCLHALLSQSHTDFKAVVVDNASTDGSQFFVTELNDPRLTLLQLPKNIGFAAANNRAMKELVSCDWVALLNPDAFPDKRWLENLLTAAQTYPLSAGFGSHLLVAANPKVSDGTGDQYHFSGRPSRRDHGILVSASHLEPGDIFAPCAAAALYRRSVWEDIGGLDEDFFCYLEDVDYAFRAQLMGLGFKYVPSAICAHVGSGITGPHSDFAAYHGQRNLLWVFIKNMPSPLLWMLLPLHLILHCVTVIVLATRGQLLVAIRAKRDSLAALPQFLDKRKRIQPRRVVSTRALWRLFTHIPRKR